jgi:hypothetical protein
MLARSKKTGLTGSKWWILRPRTGDANRFSIAAEYASMAEFEETSAKRRADSEWKAMADELIGADWYAGIDIRISEVVDEG